MSGAPPVPGLVSRQRSPKPSGGNITAYWHFYRDNAATMLALRQAAMVTEQFGRKLARFGADEQEDVAGHLTCITGAGMRLPAKPPLTIATMCRLIDSFAQMAARPAAGGLDTAIRRRGDRRADPVRLPRLHPSGLLMR
jgi:hypothetical protein